MGHDGIEAALWLGAEKWNKKQLESEVAEHSMFLIYDVNYMQHLPIAKTGRTVYTQCGRIEIQDENRLCVK